LPAADEFTLHIMAAVAQKEASAISTRTRDALAAKKVRGAQLGTSANLTQAAREKSWVATLRAIADQLNQSGYRTRHGKAFHPMGVQRLLPRSAH
jgi:DNA invertase Pin-like site-specific DNA recombinase